MFKNLWRCGFVLAACLQVNTGYTAETWPERPVRLIVPFSPGGIADTLARNAAERMSQSLGQTMVVENRPGASATIGTAAVARAAPDGYTLLFTSDSSTVLSPLLYKNLTYTADSLTQIGEIGDTPFVLVVNADLPVKDVREFIEYARNNPNKINYASTGVGGAYHLAAELFADQNKIQMTHVPYKGGGEFLVSLLNGETHAVFGALVTFSSQIAAGKLKALAVTTDQRLQAYPDLPTFREAGYPEYSVSARFGVTVPAATPADVQRKLTAAVNYALQDETFRKQFEILGMRVLTETTAQSYAEHTRKDIVMWSAVIDKLGIRLN